MTWKNIITHLCTSTKTVSQIWGP